MLRRIQRDESGQALPVVLVLILVLSLMGSGLAAHASVVTRTDSATRDAGHTLYAADAAAELAIWWQRNGNAGNPPPITVNGMNATAAISYSGGYPGGPGWPQWANDPQSTGKSSQSGPASYNQRWSAPNLGSQASAFSSPAAAADGYVYVGSSGSTPGLYAYRPDGSLAYSWSTGNSAIKVSAPPAILTTGGSRMIIVATNATAGGSASTVYGLTENAAQDGVSVTWSYGVGNGTGKGFIAGPKLNSGGTRVYVGAQNKTVYAFNTASSGTATPLWTTTLNAAITQPVALNADESRLYVLGGSRLYALLTAGGTQKWFQNTTGVPGPPVFRSVGGRDHVYLVSGSDHRVRAYADLGNSTTADWTVDFFGAGAANGLAYSPPALAAGGVLYVGLDNGEVWRLEDQGTAVCTPVAACVSGNAWILATASSAIRVAPVVGASGRLYLGNNAGTLYRVTDNTTTGAVSWSQALGLGAVGSGLAIGNDSDLYGFTASGRLFAAGPDYAGPYVSITASAGGTTVSTGYQVPWPGTPASWTVSP